MLRDSVWTPSGLGPAPKRSPSLFGPMCDHDKRENGCSGYSSMQTSDHCLAVHPIGRATAFFTQGSLPDETLSPQSVLLLPLYLTWRSPPHQNPPLRRWPPPQTRHPTPEAGTPGPMRAQHPPRHPPQLRPHPSPTVSSARASSRRVSQTTHTHKQHAHPRRKGKINSPGPSEWCPESPAPPKSASPP